MKVGGVFLQTAMLQAVRLVSGVCRAKLIALYLGPAGVGIFAQAQYLQSLILAVGSLSLGTGYIQRMRALSGRYSEEYYRQVHGTVFYTLLASVLALLLGLTPFLPWIERITFAGTVTPGFSAFVLWSVPLLALAQIYFESRLISSDRYGDYVKATCLTSILSVFVLWLLLGNVEGWALSLYLMGISAFSCLILAYFTYRNCGKEALLPSLHWKWSHFRPIMKVSVALVISGIAFYGTAVWLRALVLKHLGAEYAGFIQVPIVVSGYYAPLLSQIIWNVYHVRLSESSHKAQITKILAASITFVATLQPLIAIWIMAFPGLAVGLIYTWEFRHGINTFPIQFLGDFFYFLLTVLSVQILAQNRIRLYIALWLVFSAVEFAAGTYFILEHKLALRSLAMAYFTASALTTFLFFWPAMGEFWKFSKSAFWLSKKACLVGLGFLALQAQLLRVDADFSSRFLVACIYTLIVLAVIWRRRTPLWRSRWRELIYGES